MNPIPIHDQKDLVDFLLHALNSRDGDGRPIAILAKGDGRLWLYSQLAGVDSNNEDRSIRLEDTGELTNVNFGHDSSGDPIALLALDTGELKAALVGTDEAGNPDVARTDPNRILWGRRYRQLVAVDPVLVPSTDGILLDGSSSLGGTGEWEVTLVVTNVDGTNAVTVDIWQDVGAGGTPAATAEYILRQVTIPAGGSSGPEMVRISGNDDIRGVAGAANDAAIRFIRVERTDNGA